MSSKLQPVVFDEPVEVQEPLDEVQPGQWWWRSGEEGRALVCVMRLGSNYVEVRAVNGETWRDASENWFDTFDRAEDAEEYIAERQAQYRDEVQSILAAIQEITRQLGVSSQTQLTAEQTTQALALRGEHKDYSEYEKALVEAQERTIPGLYDKMRRVNERLRSWLLAPTLPMTVAVVDQGEIIGAIKNRVFNVELYAGLVEKVHEICGGEPAAFHEKLHLMQRRHYMDEECLVAYETGGMSFGSIREFDRWLAQPAHRDRIFPFPRCMVAFQVRRYSKQFSGYLLDDFIAFRAETCYDKTTFLYIRNGEQLHCLETEIEFGEQLFPDLDQSVLASGEKVYAHVSYGGRTQLMTEGEYLERTRQHAENLKKWKIEHAQWEKDRAEWDALSREEQDAGQERWVSWVGPSKPQNFVAGYEPFDRTNLYYDDIVEDIKREAEEYNRVCLIVQGLFDRSQVLHPHPKVRTWTAEGFAAAIELHYDQSQALAPANLPDFAAYQARLNASLKPGCKTVGQRAAYQEAHRRAKEHATGRHSSFDPGHGPGKVAEVAEIKPRAQKAVFRWEERTQNWRWDVKSPTKPRRFVVPIDKLLNLDAYTPGDFRQFYEDPRTRAEYAAWAPYLLLAEEHYAGNVDEEGNPTTKARRKTCQRCGQVWYRRHTCSRAGDEWDEEEDEGT